MKVGACQRWQAPLFEEIDMSHIKSIVFDPFTQIMEKTSFNEQTGEVESSRFQDVEPILDFNKHARNHVNTGAFGNANVHHVARIPLIVIEKWKRDGVIDWFNSTDAQRRKVLNDPANEFFRTRKCKL